MSDKEEKKDERARIKYWSIRIGQQFDRNDLPTKDDIKVHFDLLGATDYVYQLERGSKAHLYHWQCFLYHKGRLAQTSILNSLNEAFPGIHCEISIASKNGIKHLESYCMKKDETFIEGPYGKDPSKLKKKIAESYQYTGKDVNKPLHPWQSVIYGRIEVCRDRGEDGCEDTRSCNVVYDPLGNIGKSFLCKYIAWKLGVPAYRYDTANNIRHMVIQGGAKPAYLFDLTRSKPKDFSMSDLYCCMEDIKGGYIVSGKYQGGMLLMPSPEVWIFSNDLPDYKAMSSDRWKVWYVDADKNLQRFVPSYNTSSSSSGAAGAQPAAGDLR